MLRSPVRSWLALFALSLLPPLTSGCSAHAKYDDERQAAILDSAELADIERGERSARGIVAVRYTSAQWESIDAQIELVDTQQFLALTQDQPVFLASPILPKDPDRRTAGIIDPERLDMLITPGGPGVDLGDHALPDFLNKGSDGTEGSIEPKAYSCSSTFRTEKVACGGSSCPSGTCRLIGARLAGSRTTYFACLCY